MKIIKYILQYRSYKNILSATNNDYRLYYVGPFVNAMWAKDVNEATLFDTEDEGVQEYKWLSKYRWDGTNTTDGDYDNRARISVVPVEIQEEIPRTVLGVL